jgi:hypothetical protein
MQARQHSKDGDALTEHQHKLMMCCCCCCCCSVSVQKELLDLSVASVQVRRAAGGAGIAASIAAGLQGGGLHADMFCSH